MATAAAAATEEKLMPVAHGGGRSGRAAADAAAAATCGWMDLRGEQLSCTTVIPAYFDNTSFQLLLN